MSIPSVYRFRWRERLGNYRSRPAERGLAGRGHVGKQGHVAGALDRAGNHALFHGIGAGALARLDLTVAAHDLPERFGVFVIDVFLAGCADPGNLDLWPVEGLELFRAFPRLASHAFDSRILNYCAARQSI